MPAPITGKAPRPVANVTPGNPVVSAELEFHSASPAERLEAYRNVHDVWSGGLDLEAHLRRRLQSVQHNRARWYVGTLGGRVVTSLGCYPLNFRLHGETVPGIAIGSVHTVAEYRRRGFAARLIQYVEADASARRAALSLLFSDIDPAYYARLGYRAAPALEGWRGAAPLPEVPAAELLRLVPRPADEVRKLLPACYEQFHENLALWIERGEEYWEYLFAKAAADEFCLASASDASCRGYAILSHSAGVCRVRDWAAASHDQAAIRGLIVGILRRAAERGAQRVGGWLPDVPPVRELFTLAPRHREITMLKPLSAGCGLGLAAISAAMQFREIDHV